MRKLLQEHGEATLEIVIAIMILLLVFVIVSDIRKDNREGSSYLVGQAAWYGKEDPTDPFPHITTASGSRFNEMSFTCAMRSRDFGKKYEVTNMETGKSVIVLHNDYGPAMSYKGRDLSDRVIDLSRAAFEQIAPLETGVLKVKVKEVKQ